MARKTKKASVTSHGAVAEDENDLMLVGFHFHATVNKDKTPYDFMRDENGKPPTYTSAPMGVRRYDLRHGIPTTCDIPSLEMWNKGCWVADMTEEELPNAVKYMADEEAWESWIVSGDGMPSNWEYVLYRCPQQIAHDIDAKHPRLWPAGLRKMVTGTPASKGWDPFKPKEDKEKTKPITGFQTTAPPLPLGVRIRCACGHWFKESDLKAHIGICAVTNGGTADWAVMCASECGCTDLDEASTPKPGFPRPKTVTATEEVSTMDETAVETPEEGESEPTEDTPEEETPKEEETSVA